MQYGGMQNFGDHDLTQVTSSVDLRACCAMSGTDLCYAPTACTARVLGHGSCSLVASALSWYAFTMLGLY
eukprot:3891048-Rhodomonas_salina.7